MPSHLSASDNGHGNPENGNSHSASSPESSSPVATKSCKPKTSNHLEISTSSSATSTPTGTTTAPISHSQSSRKHSYTHGLTNDPSHNPNHDSSSTPTINKNQFLLEQQIKMTQLHQLQQLQHHIFQQQMALISGQSTPMNSILPESSSTELVGIRSVGSNGVTPLDLNGSGAVGAVRTQSLHDSQQNLAEGLQQHQNQDGETQSGPHTFSGLPTPAASCEIRPVDYNTTSPPMMNLMGSLNLQYIEPLPISMIPSSNSSIRSPSSNPPQPHLNISERYGHRHSSSLSLPPVQLQNNRQSHASYPSSPSTFSQNSATSPTFHPISPMHLPISPYHRPSNSHLSIPHQSAHLSQSQSQMQPPRHSHPSSSPSTPISAPSERIDFSIYGAKGGGSVHATPHLHPSNTVHTSPSCLGPGVASLNGGAQQLLDLDQDISPLTSPWLGATASASGSLVQKAQTSQTHHARRTSISGNKRTASESGDEGEAWSRGGTNRNSRKRPVLGNGGRTGSFTGSVGSNASATPGLVGSEKEKGGERDDGKNRGSTSPLTRKSTSPTGSSPVATSTTTSLARDPPTRDGAASGHSNAHAPGNSTGGSSRRAGRGSRSASTTSTPLLRSTSTNNLLLSPVLSAGGVGGGREGRSNRFGGGVQGQGQGQELNPPSPVDLNLDGQDGSSGRFMPPPPLPRGGVDVDMNSTEPTSPMDDASHLRHGMMDMGGMAFDSMMSLDEGMNVGMVGMGMGGLGGMGMGVGELDSMSGMGMSMGGIGGMGMDEMDMGMMGGFGHSQRREELGIMGVGYGRDHDEEAIHISSSTGTGSASMRLATHQQHHSEYQQAQPHLSPTQAHHLRPVSSLNSLHTQQPMMPVATPSSILNLGRLGGGAGGRLGSALSASTSSMGANVALGANAALSGNGTGMVTRSKKPSKGSKDAGGTLNGAAASRRRSMTNSMIGSGTGVGLSPGLKPLRPAGTASESTLPSPLLSGIIGPSSLSSKAGATSGVSSATATAAGSTNGGSITATPALSPADAIGVIRQPKRTHRDAEQRRRNSQKQVIDDLRQLLPPIALPSDSNNNAGDSDLSLGLPGTSPFFFQPITATLLPGSLPPRGPPKSGGEGPNKNVSKLQVLLCGNEYIKLLKARMERRDEEIGKLRREVRRLRDVIIMRGVGGEEEEKMGREEEGEEMLDLEKDLDAVERLNIGKGVDSSAMGGSSVQGRGGSIGHDAMDEDDDDGYD